MLLRILRTLDVRVEAPGVRWTDDVAPPSAFALSPPRPTQLSHSGAAGIVVKVLVTDTVRLTVRPNEKNGIERPSGSRETFPQAQTGQTHE